MEQVTAEGRAAREAQSPAGRRTSTSGGVSILFFQVFMSLY